MLHFLLYCRWCYCVPWTLLRIVVQSRNLDFIMSSGNSMGIPWLDWACICVCMCMCARKLLLLEHCLLRDECLFLIMFEGSCVYSMWKWCYISIQLHLQSNKCVSILWSGSLRYTLVNSYMKQSVNKCALQFTCFSFICCINMPLFVLDIDVWRETTETCSRPARHRTSRVVQLIVCQFVDCPLQSSRGPKEEKLKKGKKGKQQLQQLKNKQQGTADGKKQGQLKGKGRPFEKLTIHDITDDKSIITANPGEAFMGLLLQRLSSIVYRVKAYRTCQGDIWRLSACWEIFEGLHISAQLIGYCSNAK